MSFEDLDKKSNKVVELANTKKELDKLLDKKIRAEIQKGEINFE